MAPEVSQIFQALADDRQEDASVLMMELPRRLMPELEEVLEQFIRNLTLRDSRFELD